MAGFVHHYVLLPSSEGPPSFLMKQLACREQLIPPPLAPSAAATLHEVWSTCPELRQPCVQEATQALSLLPGSSAGLPSACEDEWAAAGTESQPLQERLVTSTVQGEDMETDTVAGCSSERGVAEEESGLGVRTEVGLKHGSGVGLKMGAGSRQSTPPVMLLSSGCHDVVATLVRDSMRVAKPLPAAPTVAPPVVASAVATALAGVSARGAAAAATAAATTRPVQVVTAAQKAHPKASAAPRKNAAGRGIDGHAAGGMAGPGREVVRDVAETAEAAVAAGPAAEAAATAAAVVAPANGPLLLQQPAGPAGRVESHGKGLPQVRTARASSVQPMRASLRLTSVLQEHPQ